MNNNSEQDVGICSFISDHKGFFAIIKQRFSDFQVNEITPQGEIVHLTSNKVIPTPTADKPNITIKPEELKDEEVEKLKLLSGQKLHQNLHPSVSIIKEAGNTHIKIVEDPKDLREVMINVNDLTKERRTALHMFIKSQFPSLNSTTKEIDNSKYICVTKKENIQKKDKRSSWPSLQRYVTFVLYKENIDTMDAINFMAGKLRLRPSVFSYAGTKDKRAKTSQLVSVLQIPPQNISSSVEKMPKIKVGNFTFGNKSQKLGNLLGNHFRIALREVDVNEEEAEKGLVSLKDKGFINYFGMQRFSSSNISTHSIGRAILQGKWKEAVDLILSPRENDAPDLSDAKRLWTEKRDGALALKYLKPYRRSSIEGHLLTGLAERGSNNYVNALDKVPRNMNLMYIHAYQSYIWNSVLSKRIQKHKLNVLEGDLISKSTFKRMLNNKEISTCYETIDEENEDFENEEQQNWDEKSVHILTSEEAKNVDIIDVMLPLPGYKIVYPNNEIKEWYKDLLEIDGLSFDMFRNKVKTFSLGGTYRRIVVRPENLKFSFCFYDDPTLPLIQSDMEALEGTDVLSNRLTTGKHKALIMEFSLPTCSYATMVLRELIKMETSSKFQSTLNEGDKEQKNNLKVECTERPESSKRAHDSEDNANGNEKKVKTS